MYGGEDYDARLEQPGWDKPDFDDSNWRPVVVDDGPKGELRAQTATPVKEMEYFTVREIRRIGESYILDMGQNLSGYPAFTVTGKRGDKIRLTVAERINDDGSINQTQSGGPYYYEYTLKGEGEESWHPRFSYYGYRYIQIEGAKPAKSPDNRDIPVIREIRSCFVYNSAEPAGRFHSSNEIFNNAHTLIVNAIKSNMHAVFTDCPTGKTGMARADPPEWTRPLLQLQPGPACAQNHAGYPRRPTSKWANHQYRSRVCDFEGGFRDSPEWGSAG